MIGLFFAAVLSLAVALAARFESRRSLYYSRLDMVMDATMTGRVVFIDDLSFRAVRDYHKAEILRAFRIPEGKLSCQKRQG